MQGVVRRMGLMAYRIMMVLTAVRTFEAEMKHYRLKYGFPRLHGIKYEE